ncbi:aspartate aminotransferase [Clostridium tetanomorphum]|uniref:Aminotransferase n=1 Tax=Clostridium tetanomorphum TaxID=1553 RepID=A0A923J2F1_CLOTT|nr:pyridoxal phosphate-dependent aminotransferase [Clostridium tetanomorphum]KAJ52531.1 aspartate aminotransferase [Clostridium tetanomorphum DSM 665]MBC2399789.1 pyridoxal phosphate-dependent aminotransferase [Clostridium tetanomorphum]MBP1864210.1 aspartate aminotransferase [Clostridium tetanomorphum]NRS84623.1 aspartate aminotransferase [Clostridium tetanomorphum]NRZ97838.1 aspartate aminotransferase [Clostridium tetanomorphum]
MIFSKKAEQIAPSITLAITAKAKEMKKKGIDVIGFGAGEPDFNTPENIQSASIDAMKKGLTKYTPASGIVELKEAIVKKIKTENNLDYKASQIIISTGAKQCLANAFSAILNPGDEVIIPTPYWVSYPELVKISDGVPVFAKTDKNNSYKYDLNELENIVNNRTKAIVINSPNNPTGSVCAKEELLQLAEFAKKHDLIIISDEIYEKLIYGKEEHISIASLSEDAYKRTIVINGVSKSYAMTGWRIGYAAADEQIIKLMSNIQSHTTSNPNSIAQYAALEALNGEQNSVYSMIEEFKKRRDYTVKRINDIKELSCIEPKGAFYVFIDISKLIGKTIDGEEIKGSLDFCDKLLEKGNVAAIPGAGFGLDQFIRISYATSMDNIQKGLDRMEIFINKLK